MFVVGGTVTLYIRARECLKILELDFPNCFEKDALKLPIALKIHQELAEHYENDIRFSKLVLRKALGLYTNKKSYLQNVKAGKYRIDLQGNPTNIVITQAEADHACIALKNKIFREQQDRKNKNKVMMK